MNTGARTSNAIARRNRTLTRAAAVGVPANLVALAALHAAWALGWRWPGGSDRECVETVGGSGVDIHSPPEI